MKKLFLFLRNALIFYRQKKQANKAYRSIKSQKKYRLTKKHKTDINNFCKTVLKSKKYKPWLKVYTVFNQEFKWGWMPDDYFAINVMPKNNAFGYLSEIKTLSKRLLKNVKEVPDAFYIINGQFYDTNFNLVNKENIIDTGNVFFYKTNNSNQGRGVIKICKNNFAEIFNKNYPDGVLQYPIKQHDWFDKLMPDNVCTVRITTTNFQGNVKYFASTLRVGRSGLDSVQSKNAIKIPIINSKGELSEWGMTPDYKKITQHPDTAFVFKNQFVPFFKEMVNRCVKLHEELPYFGIIGWDCVIDSNNEIKIMEYNANHPDIKFHELAVGPCFDISVFNK